MPGKTWSLISDIATGFLAHEPLTRGAAIAYYSIFSIAPLLIIVVAIAGLAFGYDAAQGAIVDQLRGLVGQKSAEVVQSMIYSAANRSSGTLATVIGIGALVLTATGAFGEIQTSINAIWKAEPSNNLSHLVRARLLSLGLVVTLGFLMLVSLVVSAALTALGDYLDSLLPAGQLGRAVIKPSRWTEMARRYGAAVRLLDWKQRLVCSKCGGREIDMVLTGQRR